MNDIFNSTVIRRISKRMIACSCLSHWRRAVAGVSVAVWLAGSGCADRDTVHVRLHARPPSTQGLLHLEVIAQVAGNQNGLRYKWFAAAGGCNPQETDKPATLFKFADGGMRDRVSVEVWRDSRIVGRSELEVKLDELQAQLATVEQLTKDFQIEITTIPPYEPQGGADTRAAIAGKVGGALAQGHSVVLYARASEVWYVQPIAYASHPVRPDNTWTSWTHTGSSYAAFLVRPGFEPVPRLDVLPKVGGYVLARTVVEGTRQQGPP